MQSCLGLRKCSLEAQPLSHSSLSSPILAFLRSWGSWAHAPCPHRQGVSELVPPTIYASTPTRSHRSHMLCFELPGDLACRWECRFYSLAVLGLNCCPTAHRCMTLNNLLFLTEFQWPHMEQAVLPVVHIVERITCDTVSEVQST